jgi:hypothetical protein
MKAEKIRAQRSPAGARTRCNPKAPPAIRTLAQAKEFVRQVGMCGIFSDANGTMPCLWNVVDLPTRKPGERGWGKKVSAIWRWKNELPARYPHEVFYGKTKSGLAVLMSIEYLRDDYFPKHHRPLSDCSALARRLYSLIKLDPIRTGPLREEMNMTEGPDRRKFERALRELQTTLNIVRRNSPRDENDTWVPFSEQYLDVVRRTRPASPQS